MKSIYIYLTFLLFGLMLSTFSCKSQLTKWEYDKKVSKIEFEKVRYKLDRQDTILIIGHLKTVTAISGFPCSADLVHLTKEFKLQLFKLASNFKIEKTTLVKNTWISLKRNGRYICVLPKDTIIQGHQCVGGNDPDDPPVSFDTEGNLRSFFSPADVKIGNIFCSGGKSNEIGLLKNGALEFCTFSIDQNINDVKIRRGSVVSFDFNGNVSSVKEK